MDIENLLYDEIETDFERLRNSELEPEKRKATVDEVTRLMDRAIEMKRLENDSKEKAEARMSEQALELQKLEEEKKDRLIRNGIGIAGIVLPLLVTIWGAKVSMEFEKEDSFTTTAGRNFVNNLFRKK